MLCLHPRNDHGDGHRIPYPGLDFERGHPARKAPRGGVEIAARRDVRRLIRSNSVACMNMWLTLTYCPNVVQADKISRRSAHEWNWCSFQGYQYLQKAAVCIIGRVVKHGLPTTTYYCRSTAAEAIVMHTGSCTPTTFSEGSNPRAKAPERRRVPAAWDAASAHAHCQCTAEPEHESRSRHRILVPGRDPRALGPQGTYR